MCTTLCFYFCIHYSMLTSKNLVSISYHTVDSLYLFHPPPYPFPSGNHYYVLCVYVFVFVWFGLFIYFVLFCLFVCFLFFYKFIYLFIFAVLGLRFCVRAFSSCGERGPLFIAVRGPLAIAASLVV